MKNLFFNLLTNHIYASIILITCISLLLTRMILIILNPERNKGFGLFVSIFMLTVILLSSILLDFGKTSINIIISSILAFLILDLRKEINYLINAKKRIKHQKDLQKSMKKLI